MDGVWDLKLLDNISYGIKMNGLWVLSLWGPKNLCQVQEVVLVEREKNIAKRDGAAGHASGAVRPT